MSDSQKRQLPRLRRNDPSLGKAHLDGIDEADVRVVAAALRVSRSLRTLSLICCPIGDAGALANVLGALRINRSLATLALTNCDIGAAGTMAIADALSERNESGGRSRTAISTLCLSRNAIGDLGGRAMADMLRRNRTIRRLFLGGCGIGDDGAKALAAALVANDTIKTLRLNDNRISDVGAKAFACATLLRIRCCGIDLGDHDGIGNDGTESLDRSLCLCRDADVHAGGVPKAIALTEKLLLATDFLSRPHELSADATRNAAMLCAATYPLPGRLAILIAAHRLIIDRVLERTRTIVIDAAMPLALEKIGGGGQGGWNALSGKKGIGINALFVVCCDNPHLFRHANENKGMHRQGQGQGQGQAHESSNDKNVPAKEMYFRRRKRMYMQTAITDFLEKKPRV